MRKSVLLVTSLAIAVLFVCGAMLVTSENSAQAAFPGQSGKIAFVSDREGNFDVYTMNADGTNVSRLTNTPAVEESPDWSPDGTKIAFVSQRDGYNAASEEGNNEIYVMNADGSNQTRITSLDPEYDASPSWSPGGTKIAFESTRDGSNGIYTMNADGTNVTKLTSLRAVSPSWSSDGTKIAFSHWNGYSNDIYTINPDGTNPTNLSNGSGIEEVGTDWSPDSSKIVYWGYDSYIQKIYVMNADGTGETNLSDASGGDAFPVWSPDGTKIAFGLGEIYTINTDGTGRTNLTNNAAIDKQPSWQPLPITYEFRGFYSPIDNLPTLNATRAGNAVPVKFGLSGDQGLDIFGPDYPKSQQIDCDSAAPIDNIEKTVSAGASSLSYDAASDQYSYVWKTSKEWSGTCRLLVMKLDDGTSHRASFKFK